MTIRLRFMLIVLRAAILPALVMGDRYGLDEDDRIGSAKNDFFAPVHTMSASLDAAISRTIQLQYGLAQARVMREDDKAAFSHFLSKVREQNPKHTGILTADAHGARF